MYKTHHKLIFGDCTNMYELEDECVHLIVTSPPYYNAPFDYYRAYSSYETYLEQIRLFAHEAYRVLKKGRIVVLNIDDMLVEGQKYPIVADATRIFLDAGFDYRDRLVWKKPDGYVRISRRSGVLLQNPYPMYFYPDNLLESIIVFQKGKFNYREIDSATRLSSLIDTKLFIQKKWYMTLWEITNVLPFKLNKLQKGIAAFPEEIPLRAITLYSYVGETVLDPFLGSGTTMKVAKKLGRNSVGYEILHELQPIILENVGFNNTLITEDASINIIKRN